MYFSTVEKIIVVLGLGIAIHSFDLKEFIIPNDHPFAYLDAREAFETLTPKEQLYAHFLSRASFFGSLIVLLQVSPESPNIYRLLQKINNAESPEELRANAERLGVDDDSFEAFQTYSAGFLSYMGNYKSSGDLKIVPNLCKDIFEKIVLASAAFKTDPELVRELWETVREPMYDLETDVRQLGLGDAGQSTYFSSNCNQTDADKVQRFLKGNNMEAFISRVLKNVDPEGNVIYEIRHSGVQQENLSEQIFEGDTFKVTTGDFSGLLELVNEQLKKAKEFASTDLEVAMLDDYIRSFTQGSLEAHKEGSKQWVQNKNPNVETYIGFIETYRDPVGQRGEFEGFVAMVNKKESQKFQMLVENAENLLPSLPWPKEFEKDEFTRPDFTSLDVLTFAGSTIYLGINIPNYNEIRQTLGFKNVNLGNVLALRSQSYGKTNFISEVDDSFLKQWKLPLLKVEVALHELLGHGSGKLFFEFENGTLNYDPATINPLTNETISQHYAPGETYRAKFGPIASAMEECRADSIAMYMTFEKDVARIFGHENEADDLAYAVWLNSIQSGLARIINYRPESKEWKQAHSRGNFAILKVLLEAENGLLDIQEVTGSDGKPDLLISLDRSKIESVGRPAIGEFLEKLQVYKSTGDYESAFKTFGWYSEVSNDGKYPFLKWREIVVARKAPRQIIVQGNTVVENKGNVTRVNVLEYPGSAEGMLQSWRDRFSDDEDDKIDAILEKLYKNDSSFFVED